MMPPKGGEPTQMGGRRKTAWMSHVKATMRAHKGLKLKQVLKLAKKTYKKSMKGGAQVLQPNMVGARRRRGSTRRSRRGGMDQ
jgi:hypothetical protein